MAVGKIASSTANYGTLGKTTVKNSANGFNNDNTQFTKCEVFAPSLNLGVSVINTVVPATQGYTSYLQGPGIEGGVGYDPNFTENNITIIKPDSLPTNPAFADGRKFDRYQTSMLDMARGLQSSVIIGGDLFTTQNFYRGGLNTPNSYYMSFEKPMNIIGQQNFVGTTATMDGYPFQGTGYINLVGTNNFNYPKRSDGNFAFLYPDYGYTLGYGPRLKNLAVLGSNNFNGFVTDGYNPGEFFTNQIIGNDNFNSIMNTGIAVNSPSQGLTGSKIKNITGSTVIGTGNGFGRFRNQNNFDGTYGDYPTVSMNNSLIIGGYAFGDSGMKNFIPAGAGDQSGYNRSFGSNLVICSGGRVELRRRYENDPAATFGYPNQTTNNIVIGGSGYSGQAMHASNSQQNIALGFGVLSQDDSLTGYNVNAFGNLDKNVVIGNEACVRHGSNGTASTTQKNVIIGDSAQNAGSVGMDNCIIIGANASATATSASNEITLGDANITALRCNVTSITSLSDARDKTNIEPISNASAFIKDLKPVKFD